MRKKRRGGLYWDLVTTATPEAKINGSRAITGVTPKPSESYQQAAAENSTARRHVHTNSHRHVESILTAVTHGAKHDGCPRMLNRANRMPPSLPRGFEGTFCHVTIMTMVMI